MFRIGPVVNVTVEVYREWVQRYRGEMEVEQVRDVLRLARATMWDAFEAVEAVEAVCGRAFRLGVRRADGEMHGRIWPPGRFFRGNPAKSI